MVGAVQIVVGLLDVLCSVIKRTGCKANCSPQSNSEVATVELDLRSSNTSS
jgi:hypothetical protein